MSTFKQELDDAVSVSKSIGKNDPVIALTDSIAMSCENLLADSVAKAKELSQDSLVINDQLDVAESAINNIFSAAGHQSDKSTAKAKLESVKSSVASFTGNVNNIKDRIEEISSLIPGLYDKSSLVACESAAISANQRLDTIKPKAENVTQLYKISCILLAKICESSSSILDIDDSVNGDNSVRSKLKSVAVAEWNKLADQIKKAKEQQDLFDLYKVAADKSPYSSFLDLDLVNLSSTKSLPSISSIQHKEEIKQPSDPIQAMIFALKLKIVELCGKIYGGYFNSWESMTNDDANMVASLSGGKISKESIIRYRDAKVKQKPTASVAFIPSLIPTMSAAASSRATSQLGKLGNSAISSEKLPPNTSKIKFTGKYREDAILFLNNVEVGKCPSEITVNPGVHLISFMADAKHTALTFDSKTIEAKDGETYNLIVEPKNPQAYSDSKKDSNLKTAKIIIEAKNSVETFLDGVSKGNGDITIDVDPGNYTLSFSMNSIADYFEQYEIVNLTITQGEIVKITPKIVKSGSSLIVPQGDGTKIENKEGLSTAKKAAIAIAIAAGLAYVLGKREK